VTQLEAITEGYNQVSTALLDDAGRLASNSFTGLGSWRDKDISRFADTLGPALMGVKAKSAQVSIAYAQQVAQLAGKKYVAPSLAALDLSTKALRNGANAVDVYSRPFVQMRMALAKGDSFTDALNVGSMNARQLARTEIQLSRREASLYSRKANDNVVGYLRTLTGSENCALCYTASTQRYRKGELLPIHPGCDCGEMPIYGDTDTGQVIDRQLLDKTHEAIDDRFGFSDVTGKTDLDYRKIMVRDHGEIGPMLTVRGHKFIGPNNLDLVGKKMPLPPPPLPVSERVQKIRDRADRIDGQVISSDVLAEYRDPKSPVIKTNRKAVTFIQAGPKANKALDEVLTLGKTVDVELSRRLKTKIDQLDQKIDGQALAAQKDLAKARIAEVTAQKVGIRADITAGIKANWTKQGLSIDQIEDFMYNGTFRSLYNEQYAAKLPLIEKLEDQINGFYDEVKKINSQLDEVIAPGSKAFDKILAIEAQKLIDEIRGTTLDGPKLIGAKEGVELTERALNVYPTPWVNALTQKIPEIQVSMVKRGYWKNRPNQKPILAISPTPQRITGQTRGYSTAVHEVGHAMEDVVPGLKEMEYTFWQKRAQTDGNRIEGIYSPKSTKEFGNKDKWREVYSGKSYGLGADQNYEIFTTGVESLLGGQGAFGDSTKGVIVDDEFRQFILGVLIGL
jgi:hypothetical protein